MLTGSTSYSKPNADTIELNLFGRGQGECLAVHLGQGRWLTVDSCLGSDDKTAANLAYLNEIGVTGENLEHIICSHYDKDHVIGMPQLLSFAPGAKILVPTPMSQRDFTFYAAAHSSAGPGKRDPALYDFFDTASKQERTLHRAHANTAHNCTNGRVSAIGPSNKEIDLFYVWLASQIPEFKAGRSGSTPPSNNSVSLVLVVEAGKRSLLLGGDCLNLADNERGWTAALKVMGNASIDAYKIAHHGGESGDCEPLWKTYLSTNSIVCLAPYNGGSAPVPSHQDVARIKSRKPPAFSAATIKAISGFSHAYSPATQRLAERMSDRRVTSTIKTFGHVRARWQAGKTIPDVALFGDAFPL